MPATIPIPTALRKHADGTRTFDTDAPNLRAAIDAMVDAYPDLRQRLLDDQGRVRPFYRIYVDNRFAPPGAYADVSIDERSDIVIVPAIAGG